MQDLWSNPLSSVYQRPFCSPYSETYNSNLRNYSDVSWSNGLYVNEPQEFYSHVPYAPPRQNTLEDTLEAFVQVQNQFLQTNAAYASLHHQKTLEDTLQAFVQSQTQFNQTTSQNLQELKNSLDRIESHLNEKENEFFPAEAQPDPMTQCGNNEIKNPQVDDDKPSGVEEDVDVHELNLVETLEQDHSNVSCFYDPLESCWTNSCDFIFCEDSTQGLEVNAWKPMFELPPYEPKLLPSSENVPKVKLKPLPIARKYAHLRSNDDFPMVSPSKLDALQGGKPFDVLNEYKNMMGWNIADKKKMK